MRTNPEKQFPSKIKYMNMPLTCWARSFLVTLCLSLFAALPLHAVSPHAGTYQGGYDIFHDTAPIGVPYSSAPIDFTVENDGTISNVTAGDTVTPGTITGTVTDAGVATFTIAGTAITTGTISNGVLTATGTSSGPPFGDTYQRLNATRIYGVIPVWQPVTTPAGLISPLNVISLAGSPTKIVALIAARDSTAGWSTLTSTDGLNWTKTTFDLQIGTQYANLTSNIAYVNGRFIFSVVAGANAAATTTRIYTSTDGSVWTTTDTGLSNRQVHIWGYFKGSYVGLLANFGPAELNALTSTDGTTWTVTTLVASGVSINPGSLAVSPTLALASLTIQSPSSTTLYAGSDLATAWQSSTFPDGGSFAPSLVYGNGSFLGLGAKILLSPDGSTWTAGSPGAPTSRNDATHVSPLIGGVFVVGSFYAESNPTKGLLLRSTDGQTWNRAVRPTTAFGFSLNGNIAVLNGVAVAFAFTSGTDRALVNATLETGPGLSSVRPPFVTTEPLNQTAATGTSFGLVAAFKGNGLRTTYQWFKDGQPVSGQPSAFLTLNSPVVSDTGPYTCVATNAAGSTATRAATLIFYDPAKTIPTLVWSTPAAITYGTALSATQLNASAVGGIAGTFTYTPAVGTILGIGTSQPLSVTFTPTNTATYNSAYKTTTITVNRPAQTITFAAVGTKVTTDAPFTLAPTASSGLPVTLSVVSGPATVSGYTITLTGATGTVALRASQAGNTDYSPATAANRSFAVIPPFLAYLATAGIPGNQRGPLDDPDGDGIPNLLEYALGLAPATATAAGLPAAELINSDLTFTYTRARADVTYEVQTTVDLTFPWSATGVTQGTPDVNGVTTATVPLATPARFLRLQVTLAP
jgi:hypothetical protein